MTSSCAHWALRSLDNSVNSRFSIMLSFGCASCAIDHVCFRESLVSKSCIAVFPVHNTCLEMQQPKQPPKFVERQGQDQQFCVIPGMSISLPDFDCPLFRNLLQPHAKLLQDSHGAMRVFIWHSDQKPVGRRAPLCL